MIESFGALFRFLQLAANMIMIGGCVFLAIADTKTVIPSYFWINRLKRSMPWLAVTLFLSLVGLLATTTAQATNVAENVWHPAAWMNFIQKTHIGFIWTLREVSALVVFAWALYVRVAPVAQWRYVTCSLLASLTITIGALAGHPAVEEQSITMVLPYALHLIFASAWFGGLPGVLAVLNTPTTIASDSHPVRSALYSLKQFSTMALPVMLVVIITGVLVADGMVSPNYAALFATNYGWLLIAKVALLVIILSIAARAHFVWVPLLTGALTQYSSLRQKLHRGITTEFVLACILILVATLLASAVPAKHETIDYWPYPFRFSLDATWGDWLVRTLVLSGLTMIFLAVGIGVIGRARQWGKAWRIGLPAGLLIFSLPFVFYPIAVQSFPETYRKTPVPFDAISIANGISIFSSNCIPCHGPQAKGDGVLAKTLPKQPIDFLTEPHTAMHTAGDFFHWLTYGRFNGIMPPFGEKLAEEERWDVLNFLHANSRGYQARIIQPRILPKQPFMAAPNFSYSAHDGSSGTLKDFRGENDVLLVLFTWPASRERLVQLQAAFSKITKSDTVVLAVPTNAPTSEEFTSFITELPFPVVIDGADEITRSYALFRRTITKPDLFGPGTLPPHMEFLFDQFGYLRGRWIPEGNEEGWSDIGFLLQQISELNNEGEILAPPGDHVH